VIGRVGVLGFVRVGECFEWWQDVDIAVLGILLCAEPVVSEQFEDGEEHADDFTSECFVVEQRVEADLLFGSDASADAIDVDGDRGIVVEDTGRSCVFLQFEDSAECADEVPEFDFLDPVVRGISTGLWPIVGESWVAFLPLGGTIFESLRGVLELAVFEQLLNQVAARIFIEFDFGFGFVRGQHESAFDFRQRAGHDDEVANGVEVDGFEQLEIVEKLSDNGCDWQLADIELIASNEVEQEVEGTGVEVEFDAVLGRCHVGGTVASVAVAINRSFDALVGGCYPVALIDREAATVWRCRVSRSAVNS
jgi:hypothetical protein